MPQSVNLNSWQDGSVSARNSTTDTDSWINGNLNANKAHYAEGQAVPFEAVFSGLTIGQTYTVTVGYDTTKAGLHAFDYLTEYDFSFPSTAGAPETFPNPLIASASGAPGSTKDPLPNPLNGNSQFAVPLDPHVTGATGFTGSEAAGTFDMWGGTIIGVSTYSY